MLNIKALAAALAIGGAFAFCFYVIFALLVPVEFHTSSTGAWLPDFRGITLNSFALGFVQVAFLGAVVGLVIGTLNNLLVRRWKTSH